jgi:uncharacterized damage-inducible protein DinB
MTLTDLQLLLDYHYWARDRMLEAVARLTPDEYQRDLGNSFGSVRGTLVHVYSAEWIWCMRWQGTSPREPLDASSFQTLDTLRAEWAALEPKVRGCLAQVGESGLDRIYDYTLLSGASSRSPFWQMLQHVVNHATYHRGQVTTMLRQLGSPPPQATDLIAFYRTLAST